MNFLVFDCLNYAQQLPYGHRCEEYNHVLVSGQKKKVLLY